MAGRIQTAPVTSHEATFDSVLRRSGSRPTRGTGIRLNASVRHAGVTLADVAGTSSDRWASKPSALQPGVYLTGNCFYLTALLLQEQAVIQFFTAARYWWLETEQLIAMRPALLLTKHSDDTNPNGGRELYGAVPVDDNGRQRIPVRGA